MNYIRQLKQNVAKAKAYETAMHEGLIQLKAYLCSDKFRTDTTVQVGDVLLRLEEIETNAWRAEMDCTI